MPDVYLIAQGGFLNAFAMRLMGRNFVLLYAALLEHALKQGPAELEFILAHELGHIKRNHVSLFWHLLTLPGRFVPFLSQAYSRACEYTCDAIAHAAVPEGSAKGLFLLIIGKGLSEHVNLQSHLDVYQSDKGWSTWFHEITSTHPLIPKRILALKALSVV